MPCYSPFWLLFAADARTLAPEFARRDLVAVHPLEDEPMDAWLRRSDGEHQAVINAYTQSQRRRWYLAALAMRDHSVLAEKGL